LRAQAHKQLTIRRSRSKQCMFDLTGSQSSSREVRFPSVSRQAERLPPPQPSTYLPEHWSTLRSLQQIVTQPISRN
jgi:hypothetical protein